MNESIWTTNGMILAGETDVVGGKCVPTPRCLPEIITRTGLLLNPALLAKTPASNRLRPKKGHVMRYK